MPKKVKHSAADIFLSHFGPGQSYAPFSDADRARLAGRLPGVALDILTRAGWCSYRDQVLWLCDPEHWEPAARAWLPDEPTLDVVARTSFGDLVYWDGGMYWYLDPNEAMAIMMVPDADWVFSDSLTAKDFAPSTHLPSRTAAAREQAGALASDEMYLYVPALALGGSPEGSKIERGKAIEAHAMLAKLAPLRRV